MRRGDTPGFAYAALTLTAFLLACNHIIGRAVHGEVPPVGLSFWRWVVGVLVLLLFYLVEPIFSKAVPVSATSIGAILVLALLVSVFGNLKWNAGNRLIGPARAAIFINLIPVFGTVLAMNFLDEAWYNYLLAGGVLVGLGLYLATVQRHETANKP